MSVAENFHEYSTRPENLDISNIVRSKDKLIVILKSLTDSLKNAQNRDTLPDYVFPDMLSILARFSHTLFAKLKDDKNKLSDKTVHMVELTTECFRSLRNACAGCKRNQEEVLKTPGLYRVTAGTIMTLVSSSKGSLTCPEVVQCLRCAVQFLGNAAAGFDESKTLVWESVFFSLRLLLVTEDTTLANYTCMLIYTCLTPSNLGDLMTTKDGAEVVAGVLNHFAKSETEWGDFLSRNDYDNTPLFIQHLLYILEKLLANKSFLTKGYQFYAEKERSLLLGFIHKKLQVLEDKDGRNGQAKDTQNELRVESSNVTFICDEFKKNSAVILNLGKSEKDYQKPENQAVVNMLWALISATLSTQYRDQLQSDTELLKVTTNLLHSMTMIGKQGDNAFSPASKLAQEGSIDKNNPVFGLKRDVIRLIGNLVYKNRTNQDKIREMGGVQLIMESTNIDAKNPFLQQWAIFAIRNLCENNTENQELIGSTKLEGLADNQQLKDLGIDASVQNDKVSIKSVKR